MKLSARNKLAGTVVGVKSLRRDDRDRLIAGECGARTHPPAAFRGDGDRRR